MVTEPKVTAIGPVSQLSDAVTVGTAGRLSHDANTVEEMAVKLGGVVSCL